MKKKKYDIAFCAGVFDMFHAGHRNLIDKMLEIADTVTLLIHDDHSTYVNKGKFPVQQCSHRLENIRSTELIRGAYRCLSPDPTVAFKWLWEDLNFKELNCVYVRGDDWQDFPGRKFIEEKNIPIVFVKYTPGISSTKLRDELNK